MLVASQTWFKAQVLQSATSRVTPQLSVPTT
jgi:hypothetical protein